MTPSTRPPRLAALEAHRPHLERTVQKYGGGEDTPDLVQDVYVAACQALPAFRGDASLRTWLTRIAINKTLNQHERRRSRASREAAGSWWQDAGAASPEGAAEAARRWRRVQRALAAMPGTWREVVEQRLLAGRSYAAISSATRRSVGTVHRWNGLAMERVLEAAQLEERR